MHVRVMSCYTFNGQPHGIRGTDPAAHRVVLLTRYFHRDTVEDPFPGSASPSPSIILLSSLLFSLHCISSSCVLPILAVYILFRRERENFC